MFWEEYRDTAQLCRDEIRKGKVKLELILARDAKHNKDFYTYLSWKWKVKAKLVTMDKEKTQLLFCLSLQWQPLFPHLMSGCTAGW